jgi:hypothetical protein
LHRVHLPAGATSHDRAAVEDTMIPRSARLLMIAAALMGLAVTQPPDENGLSPAEKRIPAGHYCKKSSVRITASEKNAHPCDCKYTCTVDEHGNVTEHESTECLAFCHKNGRRCTCHVEEPCDVKGHALMDMNHRVVAMPRALVAGSR